MSLPLEVRWATLEDAQLLMTLPGVQELHLDLAAELAREHSRVWVAVDVSTDLSIIGFLCCWVVADSLEVVDLWVRPESRRRGGGQALMCEALTWGAASKLDECILEVRAGNVAARALYGALGFSEDGLRRRYYSDGEDALLLGCRPLVREP